ncbi:hypothetical protein RKD23_007842 [Streptomyces sp. SAI-170]|uniref:hypothetical protein n=1 Tax=Streptomyces sp. SAI-170 TaxID=3377729 RepID=UPI003C7AB7AD
MRIRSATALTAATLAIGVLGAAPAADAATTAYPTSTFDVTYGQTYTRGTITWYNRSVTISGEHKSVSTENCRGTTGFTLNSADHEISHVSSDDVACGESKTFSFNVPADVEGGAAVVRVCLDDGNIEPYTTYLACKRYGH